MSLHSLIHLRRVSVRSFAALLSIGALAGCASTDALDTLKKAGVLSGGAAGGAITGDEITAGLKEALTKGSTAVVSKLGTSGGFASDPKIRIPLPSSLAKARDFAAKVGLDGRFNELENKLNEAAEAATPKAKSLFVDAVKSMSVSDAKGILQGPDNAATQYFEDRTRGDLGDAMSPIVDRSLSEVGAVSYFTNLMSSYNKIPFAPKVETDLTSHVVNKGMDGIFLYIAEEEAAIRANPLKRTSELLQRVFAGQ